MTDHKIDYQAEVGRLEEELRQIREPVETATFNGVPMSPNYKGDGVTQGWVPYQELLEHKAAIGRLERENAELRETAKAGAMIGAADAVDLRATRATRDAALDMLREVEWSANDCAAGNSICPVCRGSEYGGGDRHAPGCRLAALIGEENHG